MAPQQLTSKRGAAPGITLGRGLVFGVIIIGALLAFEAFNYSTTDYALSDLLGELRFFGVKWSTILALAFCGIDFAGIARLFTPQDEEDDAGEVWYLFGAWLLAATMNAMLTWWGVSLAILGHNTQGNAVIEQSVLLRIVPIFVAVLVWLIRVLIIGTFSVAGKHIFSQAGDNRRPVVKEYPNNNREIQTTNQSEARPPANRPVNNQQAAYAPVKSSVPHRPAPKYAMGRNSGSQPADPRSNSSYYNNGNPSQTVNDPAKRGTGNSRTLNGK